MNEMLLLEKQKSQSGQALVEYILILSLTVAIILGLMKQFYKPFGDWMSDYMGQYLTCLLDAGELPTIAGSSDSGECNSKFKPGTFAYGRPPVSSGSNGSSNSASNGSNSSSGSGSKSSSSSSSSEATNAANRARGTNGGRNSFSMSRRSAADSMDTSQDGSSKLVEKLPESQYYKLRSSSSTVTTSSELITRAGLNQSFLVQNKKNAPRSEIGKAQTLGAEDGSDPKKAKKLIIKPVERKIANAEEEKPWSFSDYLKYGIIIIILVGLFLFLAGQFMQISKSMEK